MNHGWEKKKLGDVCTVIGGATPNTNIPEYWNGSFNWVTPAELHGEKYFSSSERKLTSEGAKSANLQLLPVGTVLLSSRAPIGKVAITKEPSYCNQGFKNLVCGESIYNEYLFYYLGAHTKELQKEGSGTTFKEISKIKTEQFKILLPPLAFQHKIAIELDKLNELIELKRNQLKDLDTLAQSLFYEIFGDPNSNPNYEFKSFESISINLDSKRRPVTKSKRLSGIYAYYGASGIVDYVDDYIFEGEYLLISEDGANLVSRTQPIAFIAKGKTWINNHAHVIDFHNSASKIYVMFYMNILDFREKITGAAQPKLTQKALNEIPISWPPIELQDEFASKIEAIEKQKRLIESSIADLETLLASRMDYWFNE